MSKTKKGFLRAGTILAIINAAFMIILSLIFGLASNIVTEQFVIDIIKEDETVEYFENEDGYYLTFVDSETAEITIIEDEEVKTIAKLSKIVVVGLAVAFASLGGAIMWISIALLVATNKNKAKRGLTIALLVLSVVIGDMLVLAFMIVALCLKNKPEINNEQKTSNTASLNQTSVETREI